jgi:hypothetical protein
MMLSLIFGLIPLLDVNLGQIERNPTICWYDGISPTVLCPLSHLLEIITVDRQWVPAFDDLQTATAFTYTDSVVVWNCTTETGLWSINPLATMVTTWYTAIVAGTAFPAEDVVVIEYTISTTTTLYAVYTFPGVTVTSLTPEETITMVNRTSCKRVDRINRAIPYWRTRNLIPEVSSINLEVKARDLN